MIKLYGSIQGYRVMFFGSHESYTKGVYAKLLDHEPHYTHVIRLFETVDIQATGYINGFVKVGKAEPYQADSIAYVGKTFAELRPVLSTNIPNFRYPDLRTRGQEYLLTFGEHAFPVTHSFYHTVRLTPLCVQEALAMLADDARCHIYQDPEGLTSKQKRGVRAAWEAFSDAGFSNQDILEYGDQS